MPHPREGPDGAPGAWGRGEGAPGERCFALSARPGARRGLRALGAGEREPNRARCCAGASGRLGPAQLCGSLVKSVSFLN